MTEANPFARRPVRETALWMTLLVFAFAALVFAGWRTGPFRPDHIYISAGLGAALLGLSLIDLDRFILPDLLTLPLIAAGLAYAYFVSGYIVWSIAGAVIGYGLVTGLSLLWRWRFKREGIGLGDAKLLAAGGAWITIFGLPLILLIASGTALVVTVLLGLFGRKIDGQTTVAFGPMLALSIWAVWCFPGLVP